MIEYFQLVTSGPGGLVRTLIAVSIVVYFCHFRGRGMLTTIEANFRVQAWKRLAGVYIPCENNDPEAIYFDVKGLQGGVPRWDSLYDAEKMIQALNEAFRRGKIAGKREIRIAMDF
jgi:hypothetical protein